MKTFRIVISAAVILILLHNFAMAQINAGGQPVSFQKGLKADIPMVTMPEVDVEALLAEDEEEEKLGMPFRFGFPHFVSLNLDNSGVWEALDDGGRVWRLAIKCPGAYSINLTYDEFELPDGSRFHLYSEDRKMLLGAFTSRNNKEYGKFSTAPVRGEVTILEYYLPAGASDPGKLSIDRVVHGYKDVFFGLTKDEVDPTIHFGDSGPCHVNVNCPEGDPWQNESRAVVMTIIDASRQCSAVLVNNARQDLTPYLLTADHCLGEEGGETWLVVFNYESPSCENIVGPGDMVISGVTTLASHEYSDYGLVEISEQPPESYDVHYAGWSALDVPSPASVCIHHPKGDIKKISFDDDPVISTDFWTNEGESHWWVLSWDIAAVENGSSGSPLINPEHRVVGQLQGGYSNCHNPKWDWFGKFSQSWDLGLSGWLDPDNRGVKTLDGADPYVRFTSDVWFGLTPLSVDFSGMSTLDVDQWTWDFGDGNPVDGQSVNHVFTEPGMHDASLDVHSGGDVYSNTQSDYIFVLADTMICEHVSGEASQEVELEIFARNTTPLNYIRVPVEYSGDLALVFDSFSTVGCRTEYFEQQSFLQWDPDASHATVRLFNDDEETYPDLEPGTGTVLKLYFTIDAGAESGQTAAISLDGYDDYLPLFKGFLPEYSPRTVDGLVSTGCCIGMRGNVDGDEWDQVDPMDVVFMVDWLWTGGPNPPCLEEADVDGYGQADPMDLVYLVAYMWEGGPAPADCQ